MPAIFSQPPDPLAPLGERDGVRGFRKASKLAMRYVGLAGNPNCGKTTVFNALTGLRAKVGNYPGVTVERKEGRLTGRPKNSPIAVLDLPGTYSLSPQSLDEQISRDILFHRVREVPPLDLVVVVVDGSNLQRNLYLATQIIELGYPVVVALNMIDVAAEHGHEIDAAGLSKQLGVPVVPMIASKEQGLPELRALIIRTVLQQIDLVRPAASQKQFCEFPPAFEAEVQRLSELLKAKFPTAKFQARSEAFLLLSDDRFRSSSASHYPSAVLEEVTSARQRLERGQIDWRSIGIETRYAAIAEIERTVTKSPSHRRESFSDKLDKVLTHRVWGVLIFLVLMLVIFQSIFTLARTPMDWIETGVDWLGASTIRLMPPGALTDLLAKGVIAGVGAVLVFLPQICLLFLFIGLLEDTGYMSRAAFLMDRLMSKVGLHGKSFIPMLSSFACAIPGIMATRTIESQKDRLATILIAPLMSCSARLPVYTVLIAACIPDKRVLGILSLPALTLLSMYLLGVMMALLMAWLLKKTLLKGPTPMMIMELPPYKRPLLGAVVRHMWDRSKLFIRRAGTIILGISILLWALATYPKDKALAAQSAAQREQIQSATLSQQDKQQRLAEIGKLEAGAKLRHSFAGRLGHFIEPAVQPLGFDWKIGVGIIASFASREVFVSTMSLVYNVGEMDKSQTTTKTLSEIMRAQVRPDGTPVYTTLTALALMVFYVFALQCVSTIAVVRRETNSWKWPVFQWLYMGSLAWLMAFAVFQGGKLFGFR